MDELNVDEEFAQHWAITIKQGKSLIKKKKKRFKLHLNPIGQRWLQIRPYTLTCFKLTLYFKKNFK